MANKAKYSFHQHSHCHQNWSPNSAEFMNKQIIFQQCCQQSRGFWHQMSIFHFFFYLSLPKLAPQSYFQNKFITIWFSRILVISHIYEKHLHQIVIKMPLCYFIKNQFFTFLSQFCVYSPNHSITFPQHSDKNVLGQDQKSKQNHIPNFTTLLWHLYLVNIISTLDIFTNYLLIIIIS